MQVSHFYRTATFNFKYIVENEMWHNVEFILCPEQATFPQSGTVPATLTLSGSAAFHNPYGYLPAESYGMLPFTVSAENELMVSTAELLCLLITGSATTGLRRLHSHFSILLLHSSGTSFHFIINTIQSLTSISRLCRHQSSLSPIHHLFLGVFLFCLVESALWFSTYSDLNRTGEQFCCPYPPEVVTAMSLQVSGSF
jgi:hypothetical protein